MAQQPPPPPPPPMQPPLDSCKLPQSFIDDGVEKPALMDKEAAAQYAAETVYCQRDAFIFLPAAKTPRFSFYMCSLSEDVNHCFTVTTLRPSFAAVAHVVYMIFEQLLRLKEQFVQRCVSFPQSVKR